MPCTGKPGTGRVYSQLQRRIKQAHVSGKPTQASGDCQRLAHENRHSFQEVTSLPHLRFRGIALRPRSGSGDRAGARSMAMRLAYLVTRRCVNASSIAFARVSSAGAPTRAASVFAGAGSPGDAPRASPAMSIAQAPRTRAAATPMQNVTNSVARKSTTIGRTLDLPLAASIFDPLCSARFGPCLVLKRPKRAPPGGRNGKLPKNCGGKMAMRPVEGRAEKECAIFSADLFPLLPKEGWREAPGWFWRDHPAAYGGTPPQERRG